MKQITFLISVLGVLAFWGCPPANSGSTSTKAESEQTSGTPETESQFAVRGKVFLTRDYCGGAAPPAELLEELRTPKPYPNMVVYARRGESNARPTEERMQVTTGPEGEFEFSLEPGTWCLFIEEKGTSEPYGGGPDIEVDLECYREWQATCDQVIEVAAGEAPPAPVIKIHRRCRVETWSDCARYAGPPPPSPPPSRDR
ncbi:MAG: hypothetical protein AAF998_21305 [Bacteroidota bacterium]